MDVTEEEALKLNKKFVELTFETKDDVQVPVNLTVSLISTYIWIDFAFFSSRSF